MFMLSDLYARHIYTLAATGIKMKSKTFSSRQSATEQMYDFIDKHNLQVVEIYNDKHYKTYICNDGIRFYINRI